MKVCDALHPVKNSETAFRLFLLILAQLEDITIQITFNESEAVVTSLQFMVLRRFQWLSLFCFFKLENKIAIGHVRKCISLVQLFYMMLCWSLTCSQHHSGCPPPICRAGHTDLVLWS